MKRPLTALVVAALSLVAAPVARADFQLNRFITNGNSAAGWVTDANAPPGASDHQSVRLFVNGSSSTDFNDSAIAVFKGFGATPDPSPPGFDFKTPTAGASGGSVRMVIRFSDGGKGELRPVTFVSNQWIHVGGTAPDWDTSGGTCGNRSDQTYSQVLGCHPGATIRAVEVINDSGWLHPFGFEIIVDNVTYAGETVSKPAPPVLGQGVLLKQTVGPVVVRVGARDRAHIVGTANVPVGAFVDTRRGHAKLTSEKKGNKRQSARFTDGIFKVKQKRRGRGLVDLILSEPLACGAGGSSAGVAYAATRGETSRRRRRRRRLWGRGRGRYRTRGRYSSGSVRGTKWLTQDTCRGTLTLVRNGVVVVRDFRKKKTVVLHAGEHYFASK